MKKSKFFLILLSLVLITFVACSQAAQVNEDTDTTGDIIDEDTIEVPEDAITAELELNSDEFAPGEIIKVTYTSPIDVEDDAWIGLLPSDVEHGDEEVCDEYDLDFHLIDAGEKDEVVQFTAPDEEGLYDIRMFDSDWEGNELISVTFEVTEDIESSDEGEVYIELDESVYTPEELILITYYAPLDIEDNAWIGIIPSDIEHGEEEVCDQHDLDYNYVEAGEGSTDFYAPTEPGSYDIRMFSSDYEGKEIISITFEVEE